MLTLQKQNSGSGWPSSYIRLITIQHRLAQVLISSGPEIAPVLCQTHLVQDPVLALYYIGSIG